MLRRVFLLLFFGLLATPVFAAPVSVLIDISQQKMYVSVDGVAKYSWSISTARSGYRTPIGTYKPTRMHATYYSVKYDGAPMPYSIFFHGGYAIHGTTDLKRLGSPASHGCVRLHPSNASTLFSLVKRYGSKNTTIRVRS